MDTRCRLKQYHAIHKVNQFFPVYPIKTDVILSDPAIKLSLKNVIGSSGSRNAICKARASNDPALAQKARPFRLADHNAPKFHHLVLQVLRSYQYYAVNKIADTVAKTD